MISFIKVSIVCPFIGHLNGIALNTIWFLGKKKYLNIKCL